MRLLIASLILCCSAVTGYSGESAETTAGVPIADEGDSTESVAVNVDSKNQETTNTGGKGCGCNKPKI